MKIENYAIATNRELDNAYREAKNDGDKYAVLVEMAKRIGEHMITPDVLPIFRQYKLNGGGDDRY